MQFYFEQLDDETKKFKEVTWKRFAREKKMSLTRGASDTSVYVFGGFHWPVGEV